MTQRLTRKDYDEFVKQIEADHSSPPRMIMGAKNYELYIADPNKYLDKLQKLLFNSKVKGVVLHKSKI